jgi:hypothetical protein
MWRQVTNRWDEKEKNRMFRTSKILVLVAVVAFAMMLSVGAQADTWNLGPSFWDSWSTTNGQHPVSFGYSTTNAALDADLTGYNYNLYGSVGALWVLAYYGTPDVANYVWFNYGANDQPVMETSYASSYNEWAMVAPGEIAAVASTTKQSIIRWTAAVAGSYQITGSVGTRASTAQAYQISVNANQVLARGWTDASTDQANPSMAPFTYTVSLAAGDTVDFMARANPTASGIYPVIFDAVITDVVPEPGSMLLLGMGVVGLAARVRARRK